MIIIIKRISDHNKKEGKEGVYIYRHSICNATGRVSFTIKLIPNCKVPPTKVKINLNLNQIAKQINPNNGV